jgi:DNA-binding LytR/AlgR family response regulator
MINCLIVDDEPVARNIIRNYCAQLPFLNVVAEFGNALDAKEFLSSGKIDLLFLDIHMPVLSGIGFVGTLKNAPLVIFTTAYQEYAVNAFDLSASDYLLKPFSLERFIIAVDKVQEHLKENGEPCAASIEQKSGHFYIKSEGKIHRISYQNLRYAEAQGNYTKVVTMDSTIITKMSFSTFVDQLPVDRFIRVHRSFIINRDMINHIQGNRVFIQQTEIPIAGNYKEAFLKIIGISP